MIKDQQPLIVWYSTCNDMKITPEDPVFWNEDALRCLLLIRSPCLQDLKEESCRVVELELRCTSEMR